LTHPVCYALYHTHYIYGLVMVGYSNEYVDEANGVKTHHIIMKELYCVAVVCCFLCG